MQLLRPDALESITAVLLVLLAELGLHRGLKIIYRLTKK